MPESGAMVINTGPLIALTAALGDLTILEGLYTRIVIPLEVWEELRVGGEEAPELRAIAACSFFQRMAEPVILPAYLLSELDRGEASVIQTALGSNIATVVIDEKAGRRLARQHGVTVTGTIGILLRAKKEGRIRSLAAALERMTAHGIWLSSDLRRRALEAAGEAPM